jgi:protein phosphatase
MELPDGIQVDSYGCTDVGKVRPVNEDQFLIAKLHKVIAVVHSSLPHQYRQQFDSGARALLLLVADGVGGGVAGEQASSLTLDTIVSYVTNSMRCFYKLDDQVQQELLSELALVVRQSDEMVRSEGERDPDQLGMATTLTMAHVLWPRAYVVQIGDSRCYHIRGSHIVQVTRDQTMAQYLVDEGVLTPEAAEESPLGNVLTQAIGGPESEVVAEISTINLERGDAMLLCTDGLTRYLSDDDIAEHVHGGQSAEEVCKSLIASALNAGGSDNVTVVLGRFQ